MYRCSKTAFFYYHSPLLMLRGEHKLCSLNRGGRTGSERGGRGGRETENRQRIGKLRSRFRPVQISPPRVPGSSDEAVRLPSPSLRTGSLFVHPFHTKPSCLFTNHTVIFWLPLCLPLSLCSHVCLYSAQAHAPPLVQNAELLLT